MEIILIQVIMRCHSQKFTFRCHSTFVVVLLLLWGNLPTMICGTDSRTVHHHNKKNYGKRIKRIPPATSNPSFLLQQRPFALLRGGGSSSTNRLRFAPPIVQSSSKTAPPSTATSSSTVTEVKDQIDSFLTRDSRNTFIGM